ncbi:hypothetical protein SprV_0501996400 [Sparganum proliferum]
MAVKTTEKGTSEDLPIKIKQRSVSVIMTEFSAPFALLKMGDDRVPGLLRDLSSSSHLEEHCEIIHQWVAVERVDFRWNRIGPGCFPAGELLHSADGFWNMGREIQVDIDYYIRESANGGVGDYGGTVADASKMFGQALQNLRLLARSVDPLELRSSAMPLVGGLHRLGRSEEILLSFRSAYPRVTSALRAIQ